jgi:ferrous iron transport protein B
MNNAKDFPKEIINAEYSYKNNKGETSGNLKNQPVTAYQNNDNIEKLLFEKRSEHQSNSYLGLIGKFIEPVMRPIGFDWKMTISVLSGLAAKEVVVSTMGVLYNVSSSSHNNNSLKERFRRNV